MTLMTKHSSIGKTRTEKLKTIRCLIDKEIKNVSFISLDFKSYT